MMSELEFSKKPRRMTNPPQNRREWLSGYDGVRVVLETQPERMAYFARECTWGDVMREPYDDELLDTLTEVAGGRVLGAAFKGGYGFRIRASRSSMDQMLRLAEGTGGAGSGAGAQTTRDNDQRDFNIIVPNTIEHLVDGPIDDQGTMSVSERLYGRVVSHIEATRKLYGDLVDAGVPPQDARYVALPLGFQTQWFHVMSLGNMIKMCEQRLCNGLTQHETNYLVRMMRDLVVEKHPWMADNLRSGCEKHGQCASSTMLFPPCGAFTNHTLAARRVQWFARDEGAGFLDFDEAKEAEEARLKVIQYNPDKHLYPTGMNDAMQFAHWDRRRQQLEQENPDTVFTMAGPPEFLCMRIKPREVEGMV